MKHINLNIDLTNAKYYSIYNINHRLKYTIYDANGKIIVTFPEELLPVGLIAKLSEVICKENLYESSFYDNLTDMAFTKSLYDGAVVYHYYEVKPSDLNSAAVLAACKRFKPKNW